MNTTPIATGQATRQERMHSLRQWVKRTQEVLAHRSLQGQKFNRLYDLLRTKRLVEVALDNVLQNDGARTPGVDGITKKDLNTQKDRDQLVEELNRELCHKTYRHQPVRRT